MVKSGIGYDVHPLKKGENLILGGVKISSSIGVVAYSDGDVLLHAMVDALLGAASLGDLGKYFPSSDKKWKDKDSLFFLQQASEHLYKIGYNIIIFLLMGLGKSLPYIIFIFYLLLSSHNTIYRFPS